MVCIPYTRTDVTSESVAVSLFTFRLAGRTLCNKKQWVLDWRLDICDLVRGVPQGSVLGLYFFYLLFQCPGKQPFCSSRHSLTCVLTDVARQSLLARDDHKWTFIVTHWYQRIMSRILASNCYRILIVVKMNQVYLLRRYVRSFSHLANRVTDLTRWSIIIIIDTQQRKTMPWQATLTRLARTTN